MNPDQARSRETCHTCDTGDDLSSVHCNVLRL